MTGYDSYKNVYYCHYCGLEFKSISDYITHNCKEKEDEETENELLT